MARALDTAWLYSMCGDTASRAWIARILNWRDSVLTHNRFIDDTGSFLLNLGAYALRFNARSSYATIEVYHEIFKENNHFLVPAFCESNLEVIFDIGANQGFYTLKLKEKCPACRVIAVEPNPAEYAVLCENIRKNNIAGVVPVNVAVAAAAGTLRLEVIPEIGAISGQQVRIPERPWIKDEFVQIVDVPAVPLDSLLQQYDAGAVDILKMDVEGLELDILRACTMLPRIARIVVEYHSTLIKEKLIRLLEERHFSLVYEDPSPSNGYSGDLYFVNQVFA